MRLLIVALVLSHGCSDPPEPTPDAGSDAGVDAAIIEPAPPASVAAPAFGPCPDGWREISAGDLSLCDPWPSTGREECPEHEAHFVGEPGCRRVGDACPAGGFHPDAPSDALFVEAGATGGDGTRALPFGTIADALAIAPEGGVIAIAAGEYAEAVSVRDRTLTILGACTETTIVGSSRLLPALHASGATLTVENLRLRGGGFGLLTRGATLRGRGLIVDQSPQGIAITGGSTADIEDIVIRDILETGVTTSDSSATLTRVVVANTGAGAYQLSRGSLTVSDAAGRRIGETLQPSLIAVLGAGTAHVERSIFEEVATQNMQTFTGARIELTDVVIRGEPATSGIDAALLAYDGGEYVLERVLLQTPNVVAAGLLGAGSSLSATDVVILDPYADPGTSGGHALELLGGASAMLERVRIERARGIAILATGADTSLTLRDVSLLEMASHLDGSNGRAVQVQLGASLDAERFEVRGGREIAVLATGPGTRARLVDVVLEDTLEQSCAPACPPGGIAIGSYEQAEVTMERFVVASNSLVGVQVALNGQLDLTDGFVRNNPVGANVQVDDYDFTRLTNRVLFVDNGVNLQSEALEIPDPMAPTVTPMP